MNIKFLKPEITLDSKSAREYGENLSGQYNFAEPFPHIVIDNFLPDDLIEYISELFPEKSSSDNSVMHESGYGGLHKRELNPNSCNFETKQMFNFFNSAPMLQFLEGLTCIDGLIPDPYFRGAGFHETFTGGKLGIHTDFRVYDQLHIERRVNLLIYLNKNWDDSYGGNLELWDPALRQKSLSIAPVFNRCVIFSTDSDSFHGHPDPLNTPENISRRSLALYYYSASKKIHEEIKPNGTIYKARTSDSMSIKLEVLRINTISILKDFIIPPFFFRKIRDFLNKN